MTKPARMIADLRRAAGGRRRSEGERGRSGSKEKARPVTHREARRAIRQAEVLGLPVAPDREIGRTRSELEAAFLRLCRRHRLPTPEVNVRVGDHLVDFLWPEPRLIVETDGWRYHRGEEGFEDDRERDLELSRLGWRVVRLSERQVEEQPTHVAQVLAAALSGAEPNEDAAGASRHAAP